MPIAIAFAAGTQNGVQIADAANKTSLQHLHLLKTRLVSIPLYLSCIPRVVLICTFTYISRYLAVIQRLEQTLFSCWIILVTDLAQTACLHNNLRNKRVIGDGKQADELPT